MSFVFKIITGFISLVFSLLFLLLCIFNTAPLTLHIPFVTHEIKLALPLLLLVVLSFGFLWGGLIGALQAEKIKDKLREAKKQIKALEQDSQRLKNPK
jgi:uncharacterized integral membrane protein